jgi:hypothetical protein
MYDCNNFSACRDQARYCQKILLTYKGELKYKSILAHLRGLDFIPYKPIERMAAMVLSVAKNGVPLV